MVVIAVGSSIIGCGSSDATTTTTDINYTVKKGDLSLDITAVGNLSYSTSEELSFDTDGTIAAVKVEAGDSVTKGDVLATLNLTDYQQNITDLESTLNSKQLAVTQAEQDLTSAQRTVTTKQTAVTTAERALDDAEYQLTVKERAVTEAELAIKSAELTVEQDEYAFQSNTGGTWIDENLAIAKATLALKEAALADTQRDVESAKNDISDAELAVENAKLDVVDAQTSVTVAEAKLASAQQAVVDAQSSLDEAKATSPEITAPFDGLITEINEVAGTEIYKGGAVVTIVDPSQYEAVVSVGETDIANVAISGNATVELDAITGLVLPASVTYISPTATTSSGVVSYSVTITIDSEKAITEGATTEQINQLKEGLTATVSIITSSATDVLLVPTQAITSTTSGATVNVVKNGVTSSTPIQIGISGSKYTVVTSGLSEGDVVTYTKSTTSSTSSSSSSQSGGMMIPGVGGGPGGG